MTVGNVAEVTSHKISWPIVEKANFFYHGTTAQVGQGLLIIKDL
jgi:hypothetical protein